MPSDQNDIAPCMIFINKEGRWYHKGAEMIHRDFIRLFYQNIELDSQGRYVIDWDKQRCYVDVEDTAFVVWDILYEKKNGDQEAEVILRLSDDTKEKLSPDSLFVGRDNVLYCKVKGNTFPARFNRAAYYQLANYIKEKDGAFFLPLNGKKHFIAY